MRINRASAILCAVALAVTTVRAGDESDVAVLKTDTFAAFIKDNEFVLAEFYAPWCGHCKSLAPEYEKAATKLKESGSSVKLAKIDATEEKDLATQYEVQGFPTLLWFVNGEKSEYKGGRTEETIVEWVTKKTGPAVRTGDLPEVTSQPLVVLKGKSITDDFNKVAQALGDDFLFHFVETDSDSSVSVQHKGEEPIVASSDEASDLKAFLEKNALSQFGSIDGATFGKYQASGKGLVWILMDIASPEDLPAAAEKVRPAVKNLLAQFPHLNFGYIDTISFKSPIEAMLGVTEFPAVAVNLKIGDKKKFILPGEISEASIAQFLNDVESGKIQPTLKSEEIPESNDEPVKVFVGKTLEAQAFTAEKDVLLEVYAPWCGHCKKLAPEFEKLAQKVRKEGLEDILTIAKMDGTTNDSPVDSITWNGFPTLFYIKAGTSEPIPFNGGRDAKAIWKWIRANHSKGDEITKRLTESKAAAGGDKTEGEDAGKDEL